MYDEEDSYTEAYSKQIIGKTLKGPKTLVNSYQDNKPVSKMEMARIISDLKSIGNSKDSLQDTSNEYSDVYKEEDKTKKENANSEDNSMVSETTDYNVQCGSSVSMKEQQLFIELTNEQLTQAIMYSEILGKPKCKTRRRR